MESWTAQQIKVFLSVSSRLTVDIEVLDIFNSFPFYLLNRRFCEIFAEQLIWRTPLRIESGIIIFAFVQILSI